VEAQRPQGHAGGAVIRREDRKRCVGLHPAGGSAGPGFKAVPAIRNEGVPERKASISFLS